MNICTSSAAVSPGIRLVPDVSDVTFYDSGMDTSLTHERAAGPLRAGAAQAAHAGHAADATPGRRAVWPALLLSLTLAACGGGGSDSASSGGTGTNPDAQTNCGLGTQAAFEQELLNRINAARAAGANCGTSGTFAATSALSWNALLAQAADNHAVDMSSKNFFSHTGSNGSTLGSRVTAVGYPWVGLAENIAAGQGSVQSVMDGWLASPGHCANIMNPNLQEVGVSCRVAASTANTYSTYWVMDLGTRR
ncbi:cysteine-rich secretory family protein [Roseateles depolymerans]|uniref:SCP/PR1 domain protein n=2 Tax=Roseateles depolymerans TaxID=76731 RepID=A0A0U3MPV9_9BURK|nr:SCP/PR1 domain protein [Roseateles depolymerans]REG19334.1 cysteine-rich secretory family protein [Roseateles depolymerans]